MYIVKKMCTKTYKNFEYNLEKTTLNVSYLTMMLGGREGHKCIRQVSMGGYPYGNFSDTPSLKLIKTKGLMGHAFTVCIHTENQNQVRFYPFILHEISVLIELTLGHLHYRLTVVPPHPNSQPYSVFDSDRPAEE